MRRVPTVLPACRAGRTMSVLRRAHRFGRPTAGDGLILTTPCTSSATPSRSSLLTQPETGRGDASLWTAAAAPDHRLWTTLRGPLDPSRLPTSPHPRRRLRVASEQSIQPIKGGRPIVLRLPNPESAEITSQAQTGGPFPSIKVALVRISCRPSFVRKLTWRESDSRRCRWRSWHQLDAPDAGVPCGDARTSVAAPLG